jgi:hypothetical protein
MTWKDVARAAKQCEDLIRKEFPLLTPVRDISARPTDRARYLAHMLWVSGQIQVWTQGGFDKACRWLGWLQGAVQREFNLSVDELRMMNAPEGA